MKFQLLDPTHPFFAPLWRRIAIVVVTLGWSVFEFFWASPFWGVLVGAIGVYCVYHLLIAFPGPAAVETEDDGTGG